ncbi:MAG: hypothetical protein ACK5EO_07320 [Planctomycetota bacterium]
MKDHRDKEAQKIHRRKLAVASSFLKGLRGDQFGETQGKKGVSIATTGYSLQPLYFLGHPPQFYLKAANFLHGLDKELGLGKSFFS